MNNAHKRTIAIGFDAGIMDQLGEICNEFEPTQVGCSEQLDPAMVHAEPGDFERNAWVFQPMYESEIQQSLEELNV